MPLDNPFDNLNSTEDSFLPRVDVLTKEGRLVATDAGGAGVVTAIKIGTLAILDTGHGFIGREQFKPKYRSVFVPIGTPLPPPPAGEEWFPSTRFQVEIDGLDGVKLLRIRGQIQLRRFKAAVQLFNYRPEAAEGKIPLFRFLGFDEVATDYGVYYGILLEYVGAADRDESVFGPRIVPPPPPILPAGQQFRMLPPSAAAVAPEEPAEPEAAPSGLAVEEKPETPPPESATPKVDLFSAFRPVQPAATATPAVAAEKPSSSPATSKKPGARKPY
jgi:hypothetical protein